MDGGDGGCGTDGDLRAVGLEREHGGGGGRRRESVGEGRTAGWRQRRRGKFRRHLPRDVEFREHPRGLESFLQREPVREHRRPERRGRYARAGGNHHHGNHHAPCRRQGGIEFRRAPRTHQQDVPNGRHSHPCPGRCVRGPQDAAHAARLARAHGEGDPKFHLRRERPPRVPLLPLRSENLPDAVARERLGEQRPESQRLGPDSLRAFGICGEGRFPGGAAIHPVGLVRALAVHRQSVYRRGIPGSA